MPIENKIFYVYVYLDPRKVGTYIYNEYCFDYEPFYAGKGKELRMYSHLKCKDKFNPKKNNKIKKIFEQKLEPLIIKIKENLTEDAAVNLEIDIIKLIGMEEKGPLTNLTNGGTGGDTFSCKTKEQKECYRKTQSELRQIWIKNNYQVWLTRAKKVGESLKGNQKFLGKKHTEKSKELQRQVKLGKGLGEANSQYGTCWITKEGINKKIKKEEFTTFLNQGWSKGRKIKNKKNIVH